MKKEDVYFFAKNVGKLLKTLEGLEIRGDERKLETFSKLYFELEKSVDKFTPTIQEEYSIKTKIAYCQMQQFKKLYDKGTITVEEYEKAKNDYIKYKTIRDAIKNKMEG